MKRSRPHVPSLRRLTFAVALALLAGAPAMPLDLAHADGDGQPPAAAPPAQLYEQADRKKIMSMKLPRMWKSVSGEDIDPKALAQYQGFYGEEGKSAPGLAVYYPLSQYSRAVLARAVSLPQIGEVKADSLRSGPGWAEGCAVDERHVAVWNRFVEKAGRVYRFQIYASDNQYDVLRDPIQKMLDTAAVTGDYATPALGESFAAKKSGDFDVMTDADADRKAAVEKATTQLAFARDIVSKALGGKPFDASRPMVWLFQNSTKFEDRAKASLGVEARFGIFSGVDRCALVSLLSDSATGHDDAIFQTAAHQYVWQHFGGTPPLWIDMGLTAYGNAMALGGGKKFLPEAVQRAKSAVVAGKRRLDQWFDLANWNEVTDNNQGASELFAWHWYFRAGRGAKKFKKQYDGYMQSLRDTGDPAVARKAFDGVNFDEMLQDFRASAAEWK